MAMGWHMNVAYQTVTSTAAAEEYQAFIVGANHFQNSLIAAYIETHSTWKCDIVDCLVGLPDKNRGDFRGHTAVLIDCFGMSGEILKTAVLAELDELPTHWDLVLFNLDSQACIEKSALELGVHGFFYRDATVETLLKGLTAIFGGELWVSRQKMAEVILEKRFAPKQRQVGGDGVHHSLSSREIEVLGLLTLGATNKLIAEKLFISPHTVRTHLRHIFRKIKVASRLEAMVWATDSLFIHKRIKPMGVEAT